MTDFSDFDAKLDQAADKFVAYVFDQLRPDQRDNFDDWRTYFAEARKHPNDQWIRTKAEQTLHALLSTR